MLTTNPNVPDRNLLPTSWGVAWQVRRTTATLMDFIGKYTARQVASCYSRSPSRAADSRSATQKISHFFHFLIQKIAPIHHILIQINPVHTYILLFYNKFFYCILSTLRLPIGHFLRLLRKLHEEELYNLLFIIHYRTERTEKEVNVAYTRPTSGKGTSCKNTNWLKMERKQRRHVWPKSFAEKYQTLGRLS